LRDGLIAKLDNVLVHGFAATSSVKIAGADSANELANDRIVFSQWEIILAAGAVAEDTFTGDFLAGDEVKFHSNSANPASIDQATMGADSSVFGWTFAAAGEAF